MCGRFLLLSSPDELADRFQVGAVRTEPLPVRYNVAPSTDVYAIVEDAAGRRLGAMRWGFVPYWSKGGRGGPRPINARVETVATSRLFAESFRTRRCLVPADGFYEWQDRGDGHRKQPYHLADPDGAPLGFAGLWSTWRDPADPDASRLVSVAIVTTAARGPMERIHERMPVALPPQLWRDWLTADEQDAPHLVDAVQALAPPALRATPVGTLVNAVRNDGPELLDSQTVTD